MCVCPTLPCLPALPPTSCCLFLYAVHYMPCLPVSPFPTSFSALYYTFFLTIPACLCLLPLSLYILQLACMPSAAVCLPALPFIPFSFQHACHICVCCLCTTATCLPHFRHVVICICHLCMTLPYHTPGMRTHFDSPWRSLFAFLPHDGSPTPDIYRRACRLCRWRYALLVNVVSHL